jgi:outer membrane biosynthesis protein TonB
MGIRPILMLLAACAALFGMSFAFAGSLRQDEDRGEPTSATTSSPAGTGAPTLALGRAPGLPDLRRTPRKPAEPTYAAAPVEPRQAAAAPAPASEPSTEPAPSEEPAPAPTPVAPAPVEQQAPVTNTQPRSSAPDSAPSTPAPDAAPSQPSPSPDPYASGGSQFYDDGG